MVKVILVEVERTEHGDNEEFYAIGFPRWKVGLFVAWDKALRHAAC